MNIEKVIFCKEPSNGNTFGDETSDGYTPEDEPSNGYISVAEVEEEEGFKEQ